MCTTGGSHAILRKYAVLWEISTEHWDPYAAVRGQGPRRRRPLEEILVEHSPFSRNHLKERLYAEGLKRPVCELCEQDEVWRGRVMGLILDHHQWRLGRPSAKQPADRLSELRGDAGHALCA
jgi:hypothetical protein